MADSASGSTRTGFQGAIGSLPLVDLLQVWSMNGFSGLVAVASQGRTGHLYFVDGEIVHAECDDVTGEQAVGTIVAWPEGAFDLHPNTTTLHRTLHKSLSHLLLDAHRHLDERRRGDAALTASVAPPARAGAPAASPAPPSPPRPGLVERVRAIPGVTGAVRFGQDGRPPAGAPPDAEALAAKGLYLALTHAAAIAEAFGLRDLQLASLRGARESLVVVHSAGQYLAVAVSPEAALDPVVAQLRALLTRPAARPR